MKEFTFGATKVSIEQDSQDLSATLLLDDTQIREAIIALSFGLDRERMVKIVTLLGTHP